MFYANIHPQSLVFESVNMQLLCKCTRKWISMVTTFSYHRVWIWHRGRFAHTVKWNRGRLVFILFLLAQIEELDSFLQSLHTRDWEPIHFKHSHWWKKVEPVQVRFTLRLRDQRSIWMQDGCKVNMDSYMTLNWPCFMVTWFIFKNHLLEVGLRASPPDRAWGMPTSKMRHPGYHTG